MYPPGYELLLFGAEEIVPVVFTGELNNPIFKIKPRGYGYLPVVFFALLEALRWQLISRL